MRGCVSIPEGNSIMHVTALL